MSFKARSSLVPILFFVATAGIFLWSVQSLQPHLPERVATHFDIHGKANGWMSSAMHCRFLVGFGLGTALFVIGMCHLARFLPPALLNVPDPKFWRAPEHHPVACRIVARWSWLVACLQLIFLGTLNYVIVATNQLSPPRLSTVSMVLPVAIFLTGLGVLIWGLIRSLHHAKASVT
jgi:uncharacterized membrane protein